MYKKDVYGKGRFATLAVFYYGLRVPIMEWWLPVRVDEVAQGWFEVGHLLMFGGETDLVGHRIGLQMWHNCLKGGRERWSVMVGEIIEVDVTDWERSEACVLYRVDEWPAWEFADQAVGASLLTVTWEDTVALLSGDVKPLFPSAEKIHRKCLP